ncbi:PREDICTED: probable peptidyl-tRNA hydrolase [Branchiostoma belcheri]|uniref:Probable peptidyl-tRNA hydrolase n=1 Tax=Branchiostoma belcheri TaxID=7741 RepID=A0A6P4YN47_BRABE|nr:PREDICTED: probable peptidyl-tRNA hydrolase [Branchiostoma belcheri]
MVTLYRALRQVFSDIHFRLGAPTMPESISTAVLQNSTRTVVVGLGNYSMPDTRHSVGMRAVDKLAQHYDMQWRRARDCGGDVATTTLDQHSVIVLKPRSFMNVNGESVARTVRRFQVKPEDVILVHDDLDKPLGTCVLKEGGSARGHNGVRSAISCLNSTAMRRVRVGIGRPASREKVTSFVLGRFSREEEEMVTSMLDSCVDILVKQLREKSAKSGVQ